MVNASRFKKFIDHVLEASRGEVNKKKCNTLVWNVSPKIMRSVSRVLGFFGYTHWATFKCIGIAIAK